MKKKEIMIENLIQPFCSITLYLFDNYFYQKTANLFHVYIDKNCYHQSKVYFPLHFLSQLQ